ncbi:MAG TPA: LCP family protein, partial [Anaerolineales bacterium]|nr:LCP family protein [Anaerolineales bacterium]
SNRNEYLLVAPPGSTPTATPFQPVPSTPVALADDEASLGTPQTTPPGVISTPLPKNPWGDYAGPSIWPDVDVPEPVGLLPHPDGQVNILLLGSDQRPNDGGFRTDTIQLLTINPNEGSVKITSFPRDLYVYIPGYTVQRINTAMGWGRFEALALTMEYNFGVHPDYYVLTNFWSFKEVVDSIGGISVYASRDMCDQRDGYESYCVYQGYTWMDGDTALWYVRARHTAGDIDRGRRQQEALQAIFAQLLDFNGLVRAPELYEIYKNNVTTNLDFSVLSSLLPIASHLADTQELGRYSIGDAQVYDWTNTNGAMVLVPVREAVLEVMRQVISQP